MMEHNCFCIVAIFLNYFIAAGYTPMIVPSLVRKESLIGTGMLYNQKMIYTKLVNLNICRYRRSCNYGLLYERSH